MIVLIGIQLMGIKEHKWEEPWIIGISDKSDWGNEDCMDIPAIFRNN